MTVNVGKITGGQGKNTVPDAAEALVDLRFVHARRRRGAVAALDAGGARRRRPRCRARASSVDGRHRADAARAHRRERGAARASTRACARASGLGGGEAALIGGGSDASTSSAMGIASIDGLGPRGIGFHTKDEHIERRSLVPKAQALARFLAAR